MLDLIVMKVMQNQVKSQQFIRQTNDEKYIRKQLARITKSDRIPGGVLQLELCVRRRSRAREESICL